PPSPSACGSTGARCRSTTGSARSPRSICSGRRRTTPNSARTPGRCGARPRGCYGGRRMGAPVLEKPEAQPAVAVPSEDEVAERMHRRRKRAPLTGLVLSGGGARGAYEAGIIRYIRDELPPKVRAHARFEIICGTSVGAINGCFLAANAHNPELQGRALA